MNKILKRVLSLSLAVLCLVSLCACGEKASEYDATFTYWVNTAEGNTEYGAYENNPGVQYVTNKTWTAPGEETGHRIGFEFIAASSAANPEDAFATALSNPADIMELTYSKDSIVELYNNGIAMDITEYVEKYMPNYVKFLKENGFYETATNKVNGERRFLQLYSFYQSAQQPSWLGVNYRRDWIVEYGKNPSTGAAFTGGYDANKVWSDDVMFPSWYGLSYTSGSGCQAGDAELTAFVESYKQTYTDWKGNYPVTISDWEWMMDIFETAIADLKITDGYCTSIYKFGVNTTGTIVSSFGGGSPEWYMHEDGTVHFGGTESTLKAYVEAMRTWYANGWVDEKFQNHNDLFYRTDEQNVVQGKVGIWVGQDAQLLDKMDISGGDESHLTHDICVYGAPYPINDKYGNAENKYKEPYTFYSISQETVQTMITTSAANTKEKKAMLPALFTLMDYMYTDEAAVLKGGGLTAEQLKEFPSELYEKVGLTNGLCEYDEEEGWVFTAEGEKLTTVQTNTLKPLRLIGLEGKIDYRGGTPMDAYRQGLYIQYECTGYLRPSFISQLSAEDNKTYERIVTLLREEYTKQLPAFIKGEKPMSDWSKFTLSLQRLGTQEVTDFMNEVLGE